LFLHLAQDLSLLFPQEQGLVGRGREGQEWRQRSVPGG
jgi:hypothetical protein